jgi:hypothetical protein
MTSEIPLSSQDRLSQGRERRNVPVTCVEGIHVSRHFAWKLRGLPATVTNVNRTRKIERKRIRKITAFWYIALCTLVEVD